VRWRHPERGDVAPSTFVPIAEQHGLIHALGDWVIRCACADLAARRSSSVGRLPTLSVNVSPYQLAGDGLVDAITTALAANDLPPQALCVEITESVALEHTSGIVEHINELARLGIGISVDDLGAGYASFGRLADCPWTQVKIDRSLVSRLADPAARQVALAIIELGARLGVEVIAEGVERADQAAMLRDLGCHLAQGFLYGRPAPMEQLLSLR
jgi:diguanylate cyclase